MVTRRHFLQLGGASLLAWPPFQQAEPGSGTFYVGVIADTHIIDELYRGPEGSPEDTASIFRTADRLVEAREALNALRPDSISCFWSAITFTTIRRPTSISIFKTRRASIARRH